MKTAKEILNSKDTSEDLKKEVQTIDFSQLKILVDYEIEFGKNYKNEGFVVDPEGFVIYQHNFPLYYSYCLRVKDLQSVFLTAEKAVENLKNLNKRIEEQDFDQNRILTGIIKDTYEKLIVNFTIKEQNHFIELLKMTLIEERLKNIEKKKEAIEELKQSIQDI